MFRMPALIQYRFIRFLARKNTYQNLALRVMLAKVVAKPTLSFMKTRLHNNLLLASKSDSRSQRIVGSYAVILETLRRLKTLVNCD
jgi:hypothetical protein